jgi:hypothetical protein
VDTKCLRTGPESADFPAHNFDRFGFTASMASTGLGQDGQMGGCHVRMLVGSGAGDPVAGLIIAPCEASLKRLQKQYIDLYYIHGPDPVSPLEETMRALDDLVRQGKVRYLACSNMFGWQIAKAAGISARMNLEHLIAGQYLYKSVPEIRNS